MDKQDTGDVGGHEAGLGDVTSALERLELEETRSSVAEDQYPGEQNSPQTGDSQAAADDSSSSDDDDADSSDADSSYADSSDADSDRFHRPLFDLNTHRCQHAPRYLYRVDHPGSHSITGDDGTVRARNQSPHLSSLPRFKDSLERHFQWGLCSPSPFMSTFSSLDRTRDWTRRLAENNPGYGEDNIRFYMIDTNRLGAATVFDAERLAADLNIVTKYGPKKKLVHHTAEYIINSVINADAIVHRGTWQDWGGFLQGAIQVAGGQET